jgi:hypothetical protein
MLSREELRLLNEIMKDLTLSDEKEKLQKKISLIIEQLDVMEKAQEDAAKIQDKIAALDGDKDEKEENK